MRLIPCLLCLAALALSSAASAEEKVLVPPALQAVAGQFLSWSPKPANLDYEALRLPQQQVEELNAAEMPFAEPLVRLKINFRDPEVVEANYTTTRFFVTRNAVFESGNLTFSVDAHSQTAVIEQAYTLQPGGERVAVDPNTIQVLADDSDDIFSDRFDVLVPFPALREGSIAVLVVDFQRRVDDWPLPTSHIIYPQSLVPRGLFDLQVTWAEGLEAPDLKSDFKGLDCGTPEPRTLRCRAEKIAAHPSDSQVSYHDVLPLIVLGERTTWQALSERTLALVEDALGDGSALSATLDPLLSGAETEEDRLARIHRFVSQEIRYVGLEHGVGGVVPRPAATTLQRRFGDCKDKTTLFIAMARQAGLDAFPVLTTAKRFDLGKLILPGAAFFDHMVACIRLADGGERCVDLTDPYSSSQSLSASLHGAVRLDLRQGAIHMY